MTKNKTQNIDSPYVDITLDFVLNHIDFDDKFINDIKKELFIKILIQPLTPQTTIRYNNCFFSKKYYENLNGKNFKYVKADLIKHLNIPDDRIIAFKNYTGSKNVNCIKEINFDNNIIIYKNENGLAISLLNLIRNAVAHGNIFGCHGGVLFFSYRGNNITGLVKLKEVNDVLKIIKIFDSRLAKTNYKKIID